MAEEFGISEVRELSEQLNLFSNHVHSPPCNRTETIAFTGHRPASFGGYDETMSQIIWVKNEIRQVILALRPYAVICGGALGVDTWAAEIALEMGEKFILAIPFPNFERRWPQEAIERYERIARRARESGNELVCVSSHYYPGAFQKRNEWMVDNCDRLVAVWNGSNGGTGNCVKYAMKVGVRRPIWRVNPNDAPGWRFEPGREKEEKAEE